MFKQEITIPIQRIEDPTLSREGVELFIKREDLLDNEISGNKWRKLKYNLQAARESDLDHLLTFGGAYSNHVAAVAAAGHRYHFRTTAIIRGEEKLPLNDTLQLAREQGMNLHYLDREQYRRKDEPEIIESLRERFGDFYLLPEGGSNALAVKGCAEILDKSTEDFDHICCAVGTGGTLAGIVSARREHQEVTGFPVLKPGDFLRQETDGLMRAYFDKMGREGPLPAYHLETAYHFGGYAKINRELLEFIRTFYELTAIPLDYIYTAKMVYGTYAEIRRGNLRNKRILLIHTGGLQGNAGMEKRYKIQRIS